MTVETYPEWAPLALYAGLGALLLIWLFSRPRIGPVLRTAFSAAMLALALFVVLRQAPFDPNLSQVTDRLGLDRQEVAGEAVRIRMSADGHFWVRARINGVERRMLVDSGATLTALSAPTARAAQVETDVNLLPVVMRTANGIVQAQTGQIDRLNIGAIEARNLKVVVSEGLGPVDVLGMNFLSRLAHWRVEGDTLILTPAPQTARAAPSSRTGEDAASAF